MLLYNHKQTNKQTNNTQKKGKNNDESNYLQRKRNLQNNHGRKL